jgi:hypothetical protein
MVGIFFAYLLHCDRIEMHGAYKIGLQPLNCNNHGSADDGSTLYRLKLR